MASKGLFHAAQNIYLVRMKTKIKGGILHGILWTSLALFLVVACKQGAKKASDVAVIDTVDEGIADTNVSALKDLNSLKPANDTNQRARPYETCDEPTGDMENGFTTRCVWHNCDIEEAYIRYRGKNKDNDDGKFLEYAMPKATFQRIWENYALTVDYAWSKSGSLTIDLQFAGGETTILLEQQGADVLLKTVHSPD